MKLSEIRSKVMEEMASNEAASLSQQPPFFQHRSEKLKLKKLNNWNQNYIVHANFGLLLYGHELVYFAQCYKCIRYCCLKVKATTWNCGYFYWNDNIKVE